MTELGRLLLEDVRNKNGVVRNKMELPIHCCHLQLFTTFQMQLDKVWTKTELRDKISKGQVFVDKKAGVRNSTTT